ncbi:MAG TPA: thioredoxin domain-containing protein [Acidobacteriota bacterium]|nr:thioredoxin domain-containing protein [Acidobacteriota bacterium]
MNASDPQHTNRLAQESSPYLLQHAHNPVDWYPWGEEAFEQARTQDKPVLLSIGYSACHWCHVMERESFENEDIARRMNDDFVNIKVDREERPDVDSIYMNFVQMTTGQGGWPLTVFLTPDQVPFYGGTYFPPEDRYGRPGFPRILAGVAEAFRSKRDELEASKQETVQHLERAAEWNLPQGSWDASLLDEAAKGLLGALDRVNGGFGSAPKFPSAMALAFLLRYQKRTGSKEAGNAFRLSLDKMAEGGIYDQIGGGFARYSVDEGWLVPHFEKMLYDNALLARLYLESFQQQGNPRDERICRQILRWVGREMTHPSGGFYSALDADSEGVEGKFYVWTPEQTRQVLGPEKAELFNEFYDVTEAGNFEGKSIPHPVYELDVFAEKHGKPRQEMEELIEECRQALFQAREGRVRPGLDDKVLAAWNGMMLTAAAQAAFVLQDQDLLEMARNNARFLSSKMIEGGRLKRTWKDDEAKLNGYLEDYALVSEGFIALYQASGEMEWLDRALQLTETQMELFWDESHSAFYFTPDDHEDLVVRQKEYFDNATPSGNAVACWNLLRLGILAGRSDYMDKARAMLSKVSQGCARHPQGFGYWLQAMDFALGPVSEVVVTGPADQRRELMGPLRDAFLPNSVVVQASPQESANEAADRVPLLEGKDPQQPAVYVCRDSVCKRPVHSAEELKEELAQTDA